MPQNSQRSCQHPSCPPLGLSDIHIHQQNPLITFVCVFHPDLQRRRCLLVLILSQLPTCLVKPAPLALPHTNSPCTLPYLHLLGPLSIINHFQFYIPPDGVILCPHLTDHQKKKPILGNIIIP